MSISALLGMSNLGSVINQISSDKVKERQEGISALRATLSHSRAIDRLDADGKGQTWLVVFQALFKAVLTEKALYDKKPSDTAERRLREAASAVRWLTETVVDRLNRKVCLFSLCSKTFDIVTPREGDTSSPCATFGHDRTSRQALHTSGSRLRQSSQDYHQLSSAYGPYR